MFSNFLINLILKLYFSEIIECLLFVAVKFCIVTPNRFVFCMHFLFIYLKCYCALSAYLSNEKQFFMYSCILFRWVIKTGKCLNSTFFLKVHRVRYISSTSLAFYQLSYYTDAIFIHFTAERRILADRRN